MEIVFFSPPTLLSQVKYDAHVQRLNKEDVELTNEEEQRNDFVIPAVSTSRHM